MRRVSDKVDFKSLLVNSLSWLAGVEYVLGHLTEWLGFVVSRCLPSSRDVTGVHLASESDSISLCSLCVVSRCLGSRGSRKLFLQNDQNVPTLCNVAFGLARPSIPHSNGRMPYQLDCEFLSHQ